MLKDILPKIKDDLNKYDKESRVKLFTDCIQEKLQNTLYKYNETMEDASRYLLSRDSIKVLKAVMKLQKEKDIEVLEKASKGSDLDV